MRIHPWLAALSSVLMLMAAGESSAQSHKRSSPGVSFEEAVAGRAHLSSEFFGNPSLTVRGQSGYASYGPGNGLGFQPAYSNNNPANIWPPQTPPSYQPYPAISPYFPPNVSRDSTYNDRGLWFRELLHRKRDYNFSLEYLFTHYRGPGNHTIGENPLPVRLTDNSLQGFILDNYGLGGPATFGPSAGLSAEQRVIVGPGVLPYPAIFEAADDDARTLQVDSRAFPVRTLGLFSNQIEADGIRARWGVNNEDGTGLMLTGWYGGLGEERFQLGRDHWNGVPITQDLILANTPDNGFVPVFPRNGVVPLEFPQNSAGTIANDQGIGGNPFEITGLSQKFDVLFQADVETRAFGSTLNLYHEPIWKRKWVTVRPTLGARYVYVDDRFRFRGIDSGLQYTVDDVGGGGGGGGAGGGGGGTGVPTYRPTAASVHVPTDINDVPIDLFFEAILRSDVHSHMAGPEAGFRYDFGQSENFALWGQTTFALLANHERVKITGNNIGDPLDYFLLTQATTGTGVNFTDPDVDASFEDTNSHTHASPMFEQTINMEANLLKYVPVINQVHFLEQAQFQAGFTWTVIGRMARAGDSIKWKAFPDTPFVNIDYRTWSMYSWNFGLHWTY